MKLANKLLRSVLWTSLAFGCAGIMVGLAYNRNVFLDSIRIRLDRELQTTGATIIRYYLYGDLIGLRSTLDALASVNDWCNGKFKDQNDEVIWIYRSEKSELCKSQFALFWGADQISDSIMVRRINNQAIGELSISVPVISESHLMYDLLISFFVPFLIFWILFLVVIKYSMKNLLIPLNAFAQQLKQYGAELNFQLSSDKSSDEIGQIKGMFEELRLRWHQSIEQVRQAEADIAVARISAQVAHDIRSPLTALNMIQDRLPGISVEQRDLLRSAIKRISDISDNLRDTEAKDKTESVDLIPLIQRAIAEKQIEWEQKRRSKITFRLLGAEKNVTVLGLGRDLERIISNLLNNSIEAVPLDRAPICEIVVSTERDYARIEIRDNGDGIPKEILNHLGQRGLTFGKPTGTGLGLWYALNRIYAWKGTVQISSQENVGTSIVFCLRRCFL